MVDLHSKLPTPPLLPASHLSHLIRSVNVFYRIGQESHSPNTSDEYEIELKKQEREFKIGSIGVGDSLGIMLASLIAMPTEIALCRAQVARGKGICATL